MSDVYPVHPGASYRVTMRCVGGQFLLSPTDPAVTEAVGWALSNASTRYGILVHAVSVMSTHIHFDVTDPDGCISDFVQYFKSLVARSLNCRYGRWEYFWAPPPAGKQRVSTWEAAAAGMCYTICNPVSAGLVASPEAWPGLTTRLSDLDVGEDGRVYRRTFKKPAFFFRTEEDGGELPEEATLYISPHPLGAADPERFVAEVKQRV